MPESGPKIGNQIPVTLSDPTSGFLTLANLGLVCHIIPNPSYSPPNPVVLTVMGDSYYYSYEADFLSLTPTPQHNRY